MEDRMILGAGAGAAAQAIKFSIGYALNALTGWPPYGDVHVAGAIFLTPEAVMTTLGMTLGFVATLVISGTLGVLVVYVFTVTGADYWKLKGLGVGLFAWMAFWGTYLNLGISKIIPTDMGSNIYTLLGYILWGYLTGVFIIRWGDEKLFKGMRHLK